MKSSSRRKRNSDNDNDENNDAKKVNTPARELRKRVPKVVESSKSELLTIEDEDSIESDCDNELFTAISLDKSCDDIITGLDMFKFKTPKSKTRMKETESVNLHETNEKAITSPKSPKTPVQESLKKGKSTVKMKEPNSKTKRKPSKKELPEVEDAEATTPHQTRRRTSRRLQKMLMDEESSSEDEDDDIDEGERDSGKEDTPTDKKKSKTNGTHSTETYFRAHRTGTPHTSNKTLRNIKFEYVNKETLKSIICDATFHHKKEIKELMSYHITKFNKWMFQLCEGFNLLFYGFGSKHSLLEQFGRQMLPDYDRIIVNGFMPNITVKDVLSLIIEQLFQTQSRLQNPAEQLNCIEEELSRTDGELYVIVHNIDGQLLRNEKSQFVFCKLAQLKGIHILASIDHINAPLLWDQNQCSKFNWIWHDVTTFAPYMIETSNEISMLVQQSSSLALSSMIHVFKSLTPNAKGIFLLLVNFQLSQKDVASYSVFHIEFYLDDAFSTARMQTTKWNVFKTLGMPFQDLYLQCREAFLVNSDATMKVQLTEFKDHKLVRIKKGPDGTECLLIPLEPSILETFLEQHSENC